MKFIIIQHILLTYTFGEKRHNYEKSLQITAIWKKIVQTTAWAEVTTPPLEIKSIFFPNGAVDTLARVDENLHKLET